MPPPGRAQQALAKQKEARQKKMLIALTPVLLGLLAWQGPGLVKAFTGADAPPVRTASSQTTTEIAADPTTGAAPAIAASGQTPAAGVVDALPDSDQSSEAAEGQLVAFDRFVGKDPFRQQVTANAASGGDTGARADAGGEDDTAGEDDPGGEDDAGGPGDANGGSSGSGEDVTVAPPVGGGGGNGDDDGSSSAPKTATIDVNGTREAVRVEGPFPATDPIFKLVSLGAKSAKIGLVNGEFSTGVQTIKLVLAKPVTLVSQPDGLRYTITLVSVP